MSPQFEQFVVQMLGSVHCVMSVTHPRFVVVPPPPPLPEQPTHPRDLFTHVQVPFMHVHPYAG